MDCLNTNCAVTGNDRMISCWLCLGGYHLKCTALKARDADAILDPAKSLHWTCPSCKQINIDFYKFFKSQKSEFDQLVKDFSSVQSRLSKFGDLFNSFQTLDKFTNTEADNSPKRKRRANKLASNPSLINSADNVSSPSMSLNVAGPTSVTTQSLSNSSVPSSVNPVAEYGSMSSMSLNVGCSTLPSAPVISPINNAPSNSQPITTDTNSNSSENAVKPLRAIPPEKSIFLSRLASETTVKDVEFYIRERLGNNCRITVYKYNYSQPRTITSFKVTVPGEFYEKVLNQDFWPASTFVREYIFRERQKNVVRLPVSSSQFSKN